MTLDVRDQARERPAPLKLADTMGEKRPSLRSEMKMEDPPHVEKSRVEDGGGKPTSQGETCGLEAVMSQMSLAGRVEAVAAPRPGSRGEAVRRLLGAALARADTEDVEELRVAAGGGSTGEVVKVLGRILDKLYSGDEKQKKSDSSADVSNQCEVKPALLETKTAKAQEKPKKKKDPIEELKDDDDLCPRSPMRLQHQQRNFPYQNTSRKLHSGGYVSTVGYNNSVAQPLQPQYHSTGNVDLNYVNSSPVVRELSGIPNDPITSVNDFSDLDRKLLAELLENILHPPNQHSGEESNDLDFIPTPVAELNSQSNVFKPIDHRVPINSPTDRNIVDDSSSITYGDYSDESTSGCYSLSPTSILSSSPGGSHLPLSPDSGHIVPDVSSFVPNMSPSGHFFEDNVPYTNSYNLDINISTKDSGNYEDMCIISPTGYSSIGTPSPTFHPPTNARDDIHEDFETKLQIASNDMLCSSHDLFDASDSLLDFQPEPCSPPDDFSHDFIPSSAAPTNGHGTTYTANIMPDVSMTSHVSQNINQANAFQFNNHSAAQNIMQQNANFNGISDLNKNLNNVGFHDQSTFCLPVGDAANCLPAHLTPNFTVSSATYVDATPTTVNASNVQLGVLVPVMQARLVSSSAPTLKQLKPKVEHSLRMESGKERILKLMDLEKKDQAWARVSKHLTEMAAKDKDGDTQLMILCANSKGNENSVLEYIYALVENLKKTPKALSTVNNQKQSALYLAALYSNYTNRAIMVRYIAETLLELGEDINYISEAGNSMLHELCQQGDQRYDVLVELLSLKNKTGQCYFNVNRENHEGKTPLHVAALSHGVSGVSCIKAVRLLIAEGADTLRADEKQRNTSLHLAIAQSCSPSLVEALLCGDVKNELVNAFNMSHDSPLHSAAARNDVQLDSQMRVIQLLLKHGAVKSQNAGGKFPIALVAEERRQIIKQRVYETRKGSQGAIGLL